MLLVALTVNGVVTVSSGTSKTLSVIAFIEKWYSGMSSPEAHLAEWVLNTNYLYVYWLYV